MKLKPPSCFYDAKPGEWVAVAAAAVVILAVLGWIVWGPIE